MTGVMTDNLAEWLLEQIAEDRHAAENWSWAPPQTVTTGPDGSAIAGHPTRWGRERVLAECDAKRRIVDEYRNAQAAAEADPTDTSAKIGAFAFEITMRAFAEPLAGRPGYREEWKP